MLRAAGARDPDEHDSPKPQCRYPDTFAGARPAYHRFIFIINIIRHKNGDLMFLSLNLLSEFLLHHAGKRRIREVGHEFIARAICSSTISTSLSHTR